MANLNRVHLIGRLTRKPEMIANGAGAKFGFCLNERKKNQQTGQYEDHPIWLDCTIWNRGESKQADRVFQTLDKGAQIYIEGRIGMDEWEDKNGGGKRSKLFITVETFQYLDAKQEGQQQAPQRQQRPAPAPSWGNPAADPFAPSNPPRPPQGGSADEIPFNWLMPLLIAAGSVFTIL